MKKTKQVIELVLFFGFVASANGQTAPTVHQTSTRSSCANIVALSGAKVNCSNLTPAQRKAIESIPSILKTALENQDYLDVIMKKLDEMSASQQPGTTNNAPGGFAISGGTVIAPNVNNYAYVRRTLSMEQMTEMSNQMKPFADGQMASITCVFGDPNSCPLAAQLVIILRGAGWKLPVGGVWGYSAGEYLTPPEPLVFVSKVEPTFEQGAPVGGLPQGGLLLAVSLKKAGFDVRFGKDDSLPANGFSILVGIHP